MFANTLRYALCIALSLFANPLFAENGVSSASPTQPGWGVLLFIVLLVLGLLGMALFLRMETDEIKKVVEEDIRPEMEKTRFERYLRTMDRRQIQTLLHFRKTGTSEKKDDSPFHSALIGFIFFLAAMLGGSSVFAQTRVPQRSGIFEETGVLIIIILILLPILGGLSLMGIKILNIFRKIRNKANLQEAERLAAYLKTLPESEINQKLLNRKAQLDYRLRNTELSGTASPEDQKGLVQFIEDKGLPVAAAKKRAQKRPAIDPQLAQLVLWFTVCATAWLILGTTIGEYAGIKFVTPDADHLSWLSFGRIRPVHTNMVFWGWASMGMLALGYYIVPRVGNNKLYSYKLGWISLLLINITVLFGTITLLAGVNNGGGEFREYIWPVMLPFAVALVITLYNFLKTVALRKTKEIYISNWYMIAALIFAITITLTAYLPFWQNGLGETIIQGYYMHQGVGMWFMMFTLGIVYYFLPQQLNKPIYSYSLGILAFWTQIIFYTLIGSHHFVFSSIPWWLQTVAIVGSAGMIIPVAAGTTNFIMTFKGAWYKVKDSYTLPFFIVGIIFYFTGSMQGTAEAFRSTNLIWHFTDFTVAHSHLTMYGIITFFLWAGIYAVIPRLTGKEPPQIAVGAHFWMALIGLMFYSVPLMIGGTLKGLSWIEGKPFIESVVLMAPYWLWRAIGGSLMWLSHLVFAYNLYKMYTGSKIVDVKDAAIKHLEEESKA
jgi:cytochrome c oxidase cbb3-type subunit 1